MNRTISVSIQSIRLDDGTLLRRDAKGFVDNQGQYWQIKGWLATPEKE